MNAVSEAVDQQVRDSVKSSSIETREAIFEDLLRELMEVEPDEKETPLQASSGEFLGCIVWASKEPIGTSPHQVLELEGYERRVDDDTEIIDRDELIRRVTRKLRATSS